MKKKKASGPDNIKAEALISGGDLVIHTITELRNGEKPDTGPSSRRAEEMTLRTTEGSPL